MLPFFPTSKKRRLSGARVDIIGMRKGSKICISYSTVDHMRRLTGIPLSIGACMLARGEIDRLGVFGPEAEGALNPDNFLRELARRNIKIERQETEI